MGLKDILGMLNLHHSTGARTSQYYSNTTNYTLKDAHTVNLIRLSVHTKPELHTLV